MRHLVLVLLVNLCLITSASKHDESIYSVQYELPNVIEDPYLNVNSIQIYNLKCQRRDIRKGKQSKSCKKRRNRRNNTDREHSCPRKRRKNYVPSQESNSEANPSTRQESNSKETPLMRQESNSEATPPTRQKNNLLEDISAMRQETEQKDIFGNPKQTFPKDRTKSYGDTPVPVALDSSLASQLEMAGLQVIWSLEGASCLLEMQNNGSTVVSKPKDCLAVYLFRGPVFEENYNFCMTTQNSDGFPSNTRISTTEDGVGFPMQVQVHFCSSKCKSVENCTKYPDGMVIMHFNIIVEGRVDNKLAVNYVNALREVKKPNTTTTITALDALGWLLSTLNWNYYVYPGAYIDPLTGDQIFCATIISPGFNSRPYLSYDQFNVVSSVLNRNNRPQVNPLGLFPLGNRPVVEGRLVHSLQWADRGTRMISMRYI